MTIAAGQSRTVTLYGLQRAAIANPDVADVVVVSSSELILVGKQTGSTTLIVWSGSGRQNYLVEVSAADPAIANEIKRILGYPDIRVTKVNKTVILEGTVSDQYQRARAEKIAGAYGDKVVNLLEIAKPVQIKIEAKIVEINRTKTQELGLQYYSNSTTTAPGIFYAGQSQVNTRSPNTFGNLGTFAPVNAQLNLLIQNGYAKLLSQPNLVTLSGDKANILVGGQIPVPVSNQNGQISIEWKDYGIKLDILPEASLDGIITSKVKAEVSSMEWNSVNKIELGTNMKIPPIRMRKAESSIALASGQTMAIGGLIANDITRDVTKIPLLGDLPVIGQLFRSTSFVKGETELLILVTPTIVDPGALVPPMSQELKDHMNQNPAKPAGGQTDVRQNQGANR
ncbi:MAG: BON domain-containing protein [Veillonellaceae bacterium]|nr:BON domain-containing protein [Veillonellaceae bacterium]